MDRRTFDKHLASIETFMRFMKNPAKVKQSENRTVRGILDDALMAVTAFGLDALTMDAMDRGYIVGKEDALGEQVERHAAIVHFSSKDKKPLGRGLEALMPNHDIEPQNTDWRNIGLGLNKTDCDMAV